MGEFVILVDNLNKRARTYMDSKGIAVDARCLGSIPTLNSSSKFQGDTTSEMWSGTYTYLETYSWNNKFKNAEANYSEDVKQLNDLGLNSSEHSWLASRGVGSYSSYTHFFVPVVLSSGSDYYNSLCFVNSDGTTSSLCTERWISPCVPFTI